ncbi:MAG: class I SAM-dependent methyltransferase [Chloroflexi bacterium]|nr:methyltransferase domain-containing protein [Chloroflexota bacterium]MQC82926.1 class I SAM-dependent methyltransferase [Chloroflexota bacterium]
MTNAPSAHGASSDQGAHGASSDQDAIGAEPNDGAAGAAADPSAQPGSGGSAPSVAQSDRATQTLALPTESEQPDAARLGNPSFVWRFGQERRLAMVERYVNLEGRRALDLGCGVGEYVRAFARQGARSIGLDVDPPRLAEARQRSADGGWNRTDFLAGAGEALPFVDGSLDVVVLNEVIEHVTDDRATLREVARVLTDDGRCVIFAPNRLYPFETHGIYFRKRYIFGNIPLINWLPRRIRDHFVPHARVYGHGDWRQLIDGSDLEIVDHGYVFAGYDNIAARWPRAARIVRSVSYWAEGNVLGRFGLSHLVILRRRPDARRSDGGAA